MKVQRPLIYVNNVVNAKIKPEIIHVIEKSFRCFVVNDTDNDFLLFISRCNKVKLSIVHIDKINTLTIQKEGGSITLVRFTTCFYWITVTVTPKLEFLVTVTFE